MASPLKLRPPNQLWQVQAGPSKAGQAKNTHKHDEAKRHNNKNKKNKSNNNNNDNNINNST